VRKLISILTLSLAVFSGGIQPMSAQERRVIQRLQSEITFDGVPDEAAWTALDTFPLITHAPTFGLTPSERSDIRMGYNDDYLYVGAKLYASKPEYIQAIGKKRDMVTLSSDFFGISIDSYNDKENSLMFFTNPLGLRWDATVMNDATPMMDSEPMNDSWNTFWDVKTSINDKGWYVELRIPIAKNEGIVFPAISNEWGRFSNMKPSLFEEVEFEGTAPEETALHQSLPAYQS